MAYKNLSASDREQIRSLLDNKKISQAEIAKQFGINQSDVSRIKNDKEYGKYPGIFIRGISSKTRAILETIAENKDHRNLNQFLKFEIHKLIEETPDRYKRPLD